MISVERQCFYEIWIVLWLVIMNSAENEEVEADISPPKALFSSKKFCKTFQIPRHIESPG